MQLPVLCLFLALSTAVPHPLAVDAPALKPFAVVDHGVGFSLSLDHGTTSIYYANGTVVDVARVDGSEFYKHVMRQIVSTDLHFMQRRYRTEQSSEVSLQSHFQHELRSQHVLDDSQHCRRSSSKAAAIEDMLTALKTATELYLAGSVHVVDLVVPLPPSQSTEQRLKSAAKLAGLHHDAPVEAGGSAAAKAHGFGRRKQESEGNHGDGTGRPQTILTIEYSRAALTAVIWIEENGVLKAMRILHDVDLGTNALDKCRPSEGSAPFYMRLTQALHRIAMALDDVRSNVPSMLADVVVLGEKATDVRLREALYHALRDFNELGRWKRLGHTPNQVFDPVFVAARGAAVTSWEKQRARLLEDRGKSTY